MDNPKLREIPDSSSPGGDEPKRELAPQADPVAFPRDQTKGPRKIPRPTASTDERLDLPPPRPRVPARLVPDST